MSDTEGVTFCKKMRKATREIHAISDALVNAKLAFGFQDNNVWADGLLVFYEIFRYLEGAMDRLKTTKIGLLNLSGLERAEAFERDLEFYLGKNWMKNYTPRYFKGYLPKRLCSRLENDWNFRNRESVVKYLMRLREVEDTDPSLLMAYIYHLYMGLLSGGIILRKKRQLVRKISPFAEELNGGNEITNFADRSIHELKEELRSTMNGIAENLDEDTKNKLIEESKIVYALNNEIIRSVRGAGIVIVKKVVYFVIIFILIIYTFLALF